MDTAYKLHRTFLIALVCLAYMFSSHAIARATSWPPVLKPSFEIGPMVGYTGGPRRGSIVNPTFGFSSTNSGSQDSSEIGVQMRLLFGPDCDYRPFFYLNGARSLGTSLAILLGRDFPPFPGSTKLMFVNNWLARLGIGGTTPWLFDTFQLEAGVAAALMNQTLETYAGPTIYTQNKVSVRPSIMGGVTWCLCKSLMGYQALLTAQITADSNPVINATVPSILGPENSRVNQAWVPRGDLIFSIKLP